MVSLTLIPGLVMEQLILETVSRHVNKKVITSSQDGFTKTKSCFTNLVNFHDEVTGLGDEERSSQYFLPGLHEGRSPGQLL